jgi:aldehyde dehydrogenase (NAD+)
MSTQYQLYVDGEWIEGRSGERFAAINPYLQEPWATIPQAADDDVRPRALSSADATR